MSEIPRSECRAQDRVSALFTDIDAEGAPLEQRQKKNRALKQGMMQKLLAGRKR